MPLSTQYVKLSIDGTIYCIKDFPDILPKGEIDQIETTTLCDEYHQNIDGLKNYADDLEFTMNYDEADFNTLNGYGTTQKACILLLCSSSADTTGANGKFSLTAEVSVRLSGGGVGDALEMVVILKPKSAITFASV